MPIRGSLGNYPTDYEPYFERWDCVMFYANPTANTGIEGVVPAFRHKTCGQLTKAYDKKPPGVCRMCGVDTVVEQRQLASMIDEAPSKRSGIPLNFGAIYGK